MAWSPQGENEMTEEEELSATKRAIHRLSKDPGTERLTKRRRHRPRGSQHAQRSCAHCSAPLMPGENWWPRWRPGRTPVPYVCRPCERRRAAESATKIERRYSTAQYQARKRGVAWRLGFATYRGLIEAGVCWCCSGPLSPTGSGIDRIVHTKPFQKANVVPLCGSCRTIRGFALSLEETKLIVERRQATQLAVA
jgi:RNase P subunit RPR2